MGVRLIEMQRVLKRTGSIYLHCDPAASHYLKELMDAIFGRKNFRNEIVWCYTGRLMLSKKAFNSKHDILLFYGKTSQHHLNPITEPIDKADFIRMKKQKIHTDDTGREWIWGHSGKGKSHDYRMYLDEVVAKGKALSAEWMIPILNTSAKERTGYPTQKPLELYERIVKASSNEGDVVLDPFCGCATTPIAAERLGREWVGIDIWDGAKQVVLDRMAKEGMFQKGEGRGRLFKKDLHFLSRPPVRTDAGEESSPYLETVERVKPQPDPYSRAEKVEILIRDYGPVCQGCLREFDDRLYFELDHNHPKSLGGPNLLENRILLCSPCNRIKSDSNTLVGLRKENLNRKRMGANWAALYSAHRRKAYTTLVRASKPLPEGA